MLQDFIEMAACTCNPLRVSSTEKISLELVCVPKVSEVAANSNKLIWLLMLSAQLSPIIFLMTDMVLITTLDMLNILLLNPCNCVKKPFLCKSNKMSIVQNSDG